MSQRITGRVKWFNNTKGFGFIDQGEGSDVFVHFRSIIGDGYRTLNKDQLVEFKVMDGPKGLHAEDVVKVTVDGATADLPLPQGFPASDLPG